MVGDRVGHDSLLDQAEEQLPPVARTAAIETERELVEIVIKMHLRDRTLMRPEQPTFEQRDDPVPTRQLGDGQLSIASHQDSLMAIAIRFQPIVPMPAVREYDAGGFDRVLNEGSETGGGRVGNTAHPHPSNATPNRLRGHNNQRLGRRRPSLGAPDPTDKTFVDLHLAGQPIPSRSDHRAPELVQPGPSGPIAAQAQDLLQSQGAGAGLGTAHTPHRAKPGRQRRRRILKHGAGGDRRLSSTPGALPEHGPNGPRDGTAAAGATKPIGPSQLDQIRMTRLLGREACFELGDRSRVIFHRRGDTTNWGYLSQMHNQYRDYLTDDQRREAGCIAALDATLAFRRGQVSLIMVG